MLKIGSKYPRESTWGPLVATVTFALACTSHHSPSSTHSGGVESIDTTSGGTFSETASGGSAHSDHSTTSRGGNTHSTPSTGGTSLISTPQGGTSSGGTSHQELGGSPGSGGTTETSSTPVTYDTSISEGEFSFFTMSSTFILSKAPCTKTLTETYDGFTCSGGFGGDLRNGLSNGIDGADSLCAEAALKAHPGDTHRWRAFLSSSNYNGSKLHAIDRIGKGPWYSAPPKYSGATSYETDGLLVGSNLDALKHLRPEGSEATVYTSSVLENWPFNQCLLNEYGRCPLEDGDTHDVLTGSDTKGNLISDAGTSTCDNWTNRTKGYGKPQIGHSWPRYVDDTDIAAAHWCSTTLHTAPGCGTIINTTPINYESITNDYGGGVGSTGGYGAIYCFALSE